MSRIILPCSESYQRDGSHLLVPDGNAFQILRNCQGYYCCPVDANGIPIGPIVGYTKKYAPGLHWVGLEYYDFAMADMWPAVLEYFAFRMVQRLREANLVPDIIIGAPWAGVKFFQEVARQIGCRQIFAEKTGDGRLILGRYEGAIESGASVFIGEELVNNASTTGTLIQLVEQAKGQVISILCAINRSFPFRAEFLGSDDKEIPILGVIERETPQYQQDDPLVAQAIAEGRVVWKPKYNWGRLRAAMEAHR
ncbi:MAG: hypothetical protein KBC83_02140 [Candidatus Moranbacteria bacterium]|nr:hypothetical protein [Candidatus Moranbacteria bacterium]MBP9801448.1 hypothetical protein [Candidatus Moranbacteria bacterium]